MKQPRRTIYVCCWSKLLSHCWYYVVASTWSTLGAIRFRWFWLYQIIKPAWYGCQNESSVLFWIPEAEVAAILLFPYCRAYSEYCPNNKVVVRCNNPIQVLADEHMWSIDHEHGFQHQYKPSCVHRSRAEQIYILIIPVIYSFILTHPTVQLDIFRQMTFGLW